MVNKTFSGTLPMLKNKRSKQNLGNITIHNGNKQIKKKKGKELLHKGQTQKVQTISNKIFQKEKKNIIEETYANKRGKAFSKVYLEIVLKTKSTYHVPDKYKK